MSRDVFFCINKHASHGRFTLLFCVFPFFSDNVFAFLFCWLAWWLAWFKLSVLKYFLDWYVKATGSDAMSTSSSMYWNLLKILSMVWTYSFFAHLNKPLSTQASTDAHYGTFEFKKYIYVITNLQHKLFKSIWIFHMWKYHTLVRVTWNGPRVKNNQGWPDWLTWKGVKSYKASHRKI